MCRKGESTQREDISRRNLRDLEIMSKIMDLFKAGGEHTEEAFILYMAFIKDLDERHRQRQEEKNEQCGRP